MFDCVVPTRLARNGSALTPDGRLSLRNAAAKRRSARSTPSARARHASVSPLVPPPPLPIRRDPGAPPGEPPQHHPPRAADGGGPDGHPQGPFAAFRAERDGRLSVPGRLEPGVQDHAFSPGCRPPRGGRRLLHRRLQPHLPVSRRPPAPREDADLDAQLPGTRPLHPQGPRPPGRHRADHRDLPRAQQPHADCRNGPPNGATLQQPSRRPSRSSTCASTHSASPRHRSRRRATTRSSCSCRV